MPWKAGGTFAQTLEKTQNAKETLSWEASYQHFDRLFKTNQNTKTQELCR